MRGGVFQLRRETMSFQVFSRSQATQFDQCRVQVEEFSWLRAPSTFGDPRSSEDQGHARRALPQRVFPGDQLFAQVPTVIAPYHDDRIVRQRVGLKGLQ